jgi:hypothetical protein
MAAQDSHRQSQDHPSHTPAVVVAESTVVVDTEVVEVEVAELGQTQLLLVHLAQQIQAVAVVAAITIPQQVTIMVEETEDLV